MEVTQRVSEMVEARRRAFIELSDELWGKPELRWSEFDAVEAQIAEAEREGFRITRNVGGIPTAFVAERGSGSPVIAFLGEYDALAGLSQESGCTSRRPDPEAPADIGHGCGHNLLGSASLLAASVTAEYLSNNNLEGTVRYYGCPAEEAASGKTYIAKAGAFDDVAAAVTWHPSSTTKVTRHLSLAYCQAYFHFRGVAAHASAEPERGRSALDAVELMNVGVSFLREHMPLDARVHYAIVDAGGPSPNVVQPVASVYYIVRAPTVPAMRHLYERVKRIGEGAALMTDTTLDVEFDGGSSQLLPNDQLEMAMYRSLCAIGPVPFDDHDREVARLFAATVNEDDVSAARRVAGVDANDQGVLHEGIQPFLPGANRQLMAVSTDVGDVSWVVPTVQCGVACDAFGTPAHSWQRVAQGKLSAAHKGMLHAAKAMANTAIELFTDSDLLRRAQLEFTDRTNQVPYECPIPHDVVAPPLRSGWRGSST